MTQSDTTTTTDEFGDPIAANEYSGDRECPYMDCDETADWLIETETGTAFFTCERCSRLKRLWVRENDLFKSDVRESTLDRVESETGEAIREKLD